MADTTFIRRLRLTNFLSFGPAGQDIELRPLNVLIGRNTTGKSNLLEAFSILAATPSDLSTPIREGGGIMEWLWKGGTQLPVAEIDACVSYPAGVASLRYRLKLAASGQRLEVADEAIEWDRLTEDGGTDGDFLYRYRSGDPLIRVRAADDEQSDPGEEPSYRSLRRERLSREQSVLAQKRDVRYYPEITYLGASLGEIRLYRDWFFGRSTPARRPQKTDLPTDFLLENGTNLALILNQLEHQGLRSELLGNLRRFCEHITDISVKLEGATLQIFVHERGRLRDPVSAARLSDGLLHYLCLLAILCHPTPPPLVCLEEPELGLHPEVLPDVARLLVEASERTQLIVTTHSDILVSALSEYPESILVCEREDEGTQVRRLEREPLAQWLERYALGEIWRMGEIGGV